MTVLFPCPWCPKLFPSLSARFAHARSSHTGRDLDEVGFDVIDDVQIPRLPRSNRMEPIGDIVSRILERVKPP
jgi:hypothetical protein